MKQTIKNVAFIAATATTLFASCKKDSDNPTPQPNTNAIIFSVAGDSGAIVGKLNEFRLLAGDPLNTAPSATAGRREVNWDAVPANFTNNNSFPADFFGSFDPALANGRKRGLILSNPGNSFRVDSTGFDGIDASYASEFKAFSKKRLFVGISSNVTEVTFKIPGSNTPAYVNGFAVIFSDVDVANSTTVEFFNGNKSLGFLAAKTASKGFSLSGAGFPNEKITNLKITAGNGKLATGTKDVTYGGPYDLVTMDDFLYSEPKPLQ